MPRVWLPYSRPTYLPSHAPIARIGPTGYAVCNLIEQLGRDVTATFVRREYANYEPSRTHRG